MCKKLAITSYAYMHHTASSPRLRKRNLRSDAGLTIIEVLIALVILAIGVYAVLRIFPVGFETIDASRQQTMATALAGMELERCKQLADTMYALPDAIVATDNNGLLLTDYEPNSIIPAQADPYLTPGSHPLWEPDSVFWPRLILGERVILQSPPDGATQITYFLSFAPLTNLPGEVARYVRAYYPNPLRYIASGTPGPQEYTFTAPGTITLNPAHANESVRLSYTYFDSNGNLKRAVARTEVLDGSGTAIVDGSDHPITGFQSLVLGTETVYLELLASSYTIDNRTPITGAIYFNTALKGLEVKFDYRVADWGIIREDITVPPDLQVRLSLAPVKGEEYRNPPRQSNAQALRDPADVANEPLGSVNAVVAVILEDPNANPVNATVGNYYASHQWSAAIAPGGLPFQQTLNYRNGTLAFPAAAYGVKGGQKVRIFYRTRQDWTAQVQKAAATYLQCPAPANMPDELHFAWVPASDLQGVYFAPSEAGKVVAISFHDATGNYISGRLYTIPEPSSKPNFITAPGPDELVCRVNLSKVQPVTPHLHTSMAARGVSVTARALWAAKGRSTAPADRTVSGDKEYLNEAWRQSQVTTFLTARPR